MSISVPLPSFADIENEVDALERELLELSFTHHPNIRRLIDLQNRTAATRQELATLSPSDLDPATLYDINFKIQELALNLVYYLAKATGRDPHRAKAALREFYAEADKEIEVRD